MTVAALIVIGALYVKARESAYSKSVAFSVRGLNMRLSWIALESYATHFNHGRLPPTTYVTTSGEPLFSWRMKFMLNVEGIGDGANYDKPWTSPEKHQFADAGSHAFSDSPSHDAKILAVIGEGTALNTRESLHSATFHLTQLFSWKLRTAKFIGWSQVILMWQLYHLLQFPKVRLTHRVR